MPESLNRRMLPQNTCFGCGHQNPQGLHLNVERDPASSERLLARFTPGEHMTGFPGIVHGGVLYTALDCMGAWVPLVLRPQVKAIWILRSAAVTYHRPSKPGEQLTVLGEVSEERDRGPATIRTEIRNPRNELVAEGLFKVVPLSPGRFQSVAGIGELPPDWRELLES